MGIGNPLRSEASAFALVVLVAVLAACVIVSALLVDSSFAAGVALGLVTGLVMGMVLQRGPKGASGRRQRAL